LLVGFSARLQALDSATFYFSHISYFNFFNREVFFKFLLELSVKTLFIGRSILKFENTKYDSLIYGQQHEASTIPEAINDTGILISLLETILITLEASIDSECKPWTIKL
jgi:hypothetical protein